MPASKVAPDPSAEGDQAAAAVASSSAPMPRAPILKRLAEIEHSIARMTAPDNLDGYKTLPLHTAARRGDMRETAQLLPAHRDALSQRDESGWLPLQHACCAGRRIVYRIPCATTKLVDASDRDGMMNEIVEIIETATAAAAELEPPDEPTGGDDGGGVGFSTKLARLLDDHIPDAPRYRADAPLPGIGESAPSGGPPAPGSPPSPKRQGSRKAKLAPLPDAGGAGGAGGDASQGKRAEAYALRQMREERPAGVWIEVAWVRPGTNGHGLPPPAGSPQAEENALKAFVEIILLQLHDSEYDSHVPRATGVGRLLAHAPLDVAMAAVSRALNVWPPTNERMRNQFELPDAGGQVVSISEEYGEELLEPSTGLPWPSTGLPWPATGLPWPSVAFHGPSTGLPLAFHWPSTGLPWPSTDLLLTFHQVRRGAAGAALTARGGLRARPRLPEVDAAPERHPDRLVAADGGRRVEGPLRACQPRGEDDGRGAHRGRGGGEACRRRRRRALAHGAARRARLHRQDVDKAQADQPRLGRRGDHARAAGPRAAAPLRSAARARKGRRGHGRDARAHARVHRLAQRLAHRLDARRG